MSNLVSRSYKSDVDLQATIELTRVLLAAGQMVYPNATDVFEELSDTEVQVTARLWENQGQKLVGFCYVSQYQNLVDVFMESEFSQALETEMIDWVVSAVKQRNQLKGESNTLDASSLESDLPRLAFLERNGFEQQSDSSILMAFSLDQPIPDPQLPAGFVIRPMSGETEIDAYVNLHRSAFDTENMTVEYRRTIMNAPSYIPKLDLVAVAPNGDLAAFCVCQIFPDDLPRANGKNEGWTDPVGTHPTYQHMGLAKALILAGMHMLKERGRDTALLGTSSTNMIMRHTADSIGFHHVSKTVWYSKTVL